MGSMTGSLVILLGSILLATYLFYGFARVNPEIDQPDQVVWIFAKRKFIGALAIVGEYLGLGHRVHLVRYLVGTSLLSIGRVPSYQGIKVWSEHYEEVPVRLYEPLDKALNGPAMVWIHGGAWVFGSAETDDFVVGELSRRLGILIMSIDYRLAPEHPYPAGFDDCFKASVHFMTKAEEYGFDPYRVVIAGSSAGGNLAAAVALKFRDTNQPITFQHQVLIVPCLQMFDFNTPSYQLNADDAYLPQYWMASYWLWYAFGPDGHLRVNEYITNQHTSAEAKLNSEYASFTKHDQIATKLLHSSYLPNQYNFGNSSLWEEARDVITDPYFAPLMAKAVKSLPATLILTANYDVLRDDGLMYAKRLEAAGVKVTVMHYEKGFHTMAHYGNILHLSRKVIADVGEYLMQHL